MTDKDPTDDEFNEAVDEFVEAAVKRGVEDSFVGMVGYLSTPAEIREEYRWIKPAFDRFLTPRPDDFKQLIERAERLEQIFGVSEKLDGDSRLEHIDTAKNYVQKWTGRFATNLAEDYLAPLETARANHGKLATCLRENAEGLRAAYRNGRRNAIEVAKKGTEAMESITDSGGGALGLILALAIGATALLTPLIAAAATSTLAVSLTSAGITQGLSLGGRFVSEEDDIEMELGADDADGVLDKLTKALEKVQSTLDEDIDRVVDAMADSEQVVYDNLGPNTDPTKVLLRPIRPELLDSTTPAEGFRPS